MTEPIKLMDLMSEDQCNQLMYMRILSIVEDAKGGETPYTMIGEALIEMGFKLEKYSWLSEHFGNGFLFDAEVSRGTRWAT